MQPGGGGPQTGAPNAAAGFSTPARPFLFTTAGGLYGGRQNMIGGPVQQGAGERQMMMAESVSAQQLPAHQEFAPPSRGGPRSGGGQTTPNHPGVVLQFRVQAASGGVAGPSAASRGGRRDSYPAMQHQVYSPKREISAAGIVPNSAANQNLVQILGPSTIVSNINAPSHNSGTGEPVSSTSVSEIESTANVNERDMLGENNLLKDVGSNKKQEHLQASEMMLYKDLDKNTSLLRLDQSKLAYKIHAEFPQMNPQEALSKLPRSLDELPKELVERYQFLSGSANKFPTRAASSQNLHLKLQHAGGLNNHVPPSGSSPAAGAENSQQLYITNQGGEGGAGASASSSRQSSVFEGAKILGRGAYATVLQIYDQETGEPVALKILQKKPYDERQMLGQAFKEASCGRRATDKAREIADDILILKPRDAEIKWSTDAKAGSHHICKVLHTFDTDEHLYILTELCPSTDIPHLVSHYRDRQLPHNIAGYIFGQILQGVAFLHECKIAHRDLKPDNFLFDAQWNVKITDFGWATLFSECHSETCGTMEYMAPEVLKGEEQIDGQIDLWTLGCVLFEMCVGYTPFAHLFRAEPPCAQDYIMKKIEQLDYDMPNKTGPNSAANDTTSFRKAIRCFLQFDGTNRCTTRTCHRDMAHPEGGASGRAMWLREYCFLPREEKRPHPLFTVAGKFGNATPAWKVHSETSAKTKTVAPAPLLRFGTASSKHQDSRSNAQIKNARTSSAQISRPAPANTSQYTMGSSILDVMGYGLGLSPRHWKQ